MYLSIIRNCIVHNLGIINNVSLILLEKNKISHTWKKDDFIFEQLSELSLEMKRITSEFVNIITKTIKDDTQRLISYSQNKK